MQQRFDNYIGKSIKKEVINQGLTVSQFADLINTGRTNVYDIFNRRSLDCGMLMTICEALHVNFFKEISDEVERNLCA